MSQIPGIQPPDWAALDRCLLDMEGLLRAMEEGRAWTEDLSSELDAVLVEFDRLLHPEVIEALERIVKKTGLGAA